MSIERFLRKQADLSTILPAVAGPAIGGFAGRAIGSRYNAENLGAMLGGITGGVTGQLLKENLEHKPGASEVPAGAPYALDPSVQDIPAWALQGAKLLKQSSEGDIKDIVLGDTLGPLYPLGEGIVKGDMRGAVRGIAHQGAGVAGGGLLGYGAGKVIDHLAGGPINVPFANIPLSTLLSGVGATIGGVKGLAHARGHVPGQGA